MPDGQLEASIPTRAAGPEPFSGMEHYYTLEQKTNLTGSAWQPVPQSTDVRAENQILQVEQIPADSSIFTRARIELR